MRQGEGGRMYFITCMERLPNHEDSGGDICTFGYYKELIDAERALKENRLDMHEYMYDYAIIEWIPEGIHANANAIGWHKFNRIKNAFESIPMNKTIFVNFAIG